MKTSETSFLEYDWRPDFHPTIHLTLSSLIMKSPQKNFFRKYFSWIPHDQTTCNAMSHRPSKIQPQSMLRKISQKWPENTRLGVGTMSPQSWTFWYQGFFLDFQFALSCYASHLLLLLLLPHHFLLPPPLPHPLSTLLSLHWEAFFLPPIWSKSPYLPCPLKSHDFLILIPDSEDSSASIPRHL